MWSQPMKSLAGALALQQLLLANTNNNGGGGAPSLSAAAFSSSAATRVSSRTTPLAPIIAIGESSISPRRRSLTVPPRNLVTLSASPSSDSNAPTTFRHTLAILTLPQTSTDRIANDAVLETAMSHTTHRLSVVLRGTNFQPTLSQLRAYVGEIYSSAWDCTLGFDSREGDTVGGNLLDVIVYPQNLPNAAPEGWISLRPDVDCVCSHDTLTGWVSDGGAGTGASHVDVSGEGMGGLDEHVDAINADRKFRGMEPVTALHVDPWPVGADVRDDEFVVFLEDSQEVNLRRWGRARREAVEDGATDDEEEGQFEIDDDDERSNGGMLGGARISEQSLYDSVAVGGTFDSMHYGHRKLLTLAVSSVRPNTGKLLIGVTEDDMLTSKSFSELIPTLQERIRGVQDFVDNLAPGIKNRVRIVPIGDAYGPPGSPDLDVNDFDALVLSHETLPTGKKLNEHRVKNLGMEPLMLLCTRRTEPHGMSSTALRRLRKNVRTEANMI